MTSPQSISELTARIAALSPAQQLLFAQRLERQGLSLPKQQIVRGHERMWYPLSFAQERLWLLDQFDPGNPAYNNPIVVRLCGTLHVAALEHSLTMVIQRHEVLRTSFSQELSGASGQLAQVIAAPQPVHLQITDLRAVPTADREARARALTAKDLQYRFDLRHAPLLRPHLIRLDETNHVLLLTMHHIISDGWSLGVLVREMAACYAAYLTNSSAALPEPRPRYVDFALWQREWLQGQVLHDHLDYWRRQLANAPALTDLPTDRPQPAVQTYRGSRQPLACPPALLSALRAVGQREHTTLFMTMIAALSTLLFRYTRQEDIVIGTPIANRSHVATEGMIGCFVNTLVLRTSMADDPRFTELLAQVRKTALDAYTYQHLPFEKLVQELQPERSLSHNPLFNVLLVLQSAPMPPLDLPGLRLVPMEIDNGTTRFDLEFHLWEGINDLTGYVVYSSDLFDADTITRLIANFQTLLHSIAADPTRRVSELPLLDAAERQQVLGHAASTRTFPQQHCTHDLVAAQAARAPASVAVVCDGQRLSYGELNERANQLAHYLRKRGVGPESGVALCMERSIDLIVALLAILKAGGAYIPLDPAYPTERIAFILADTGATVLITQQELLTKLPEHGAQLICLDGDGPAIGQESTVNPVGGTSGDQLAYVIYTSGSSGRPKGTLITHAHVCRLLAATHDWFAFDEWDVWTFFHSIAFDFSVWEIWGALCSGGCLVVVPYWVSRSPDAFYNLLCAERVTVLNQTPSAFRHLIWAEERLGQSDRLALRLVIFGGEQLNLHDLQPWFARHGDQRPQLVNMYGITETTVHVTYRPLRLDDLRAALGSPLGTPIPDLELYVLDEHLQPVPIGAPGEVYVGGAGLARGYLGRPDLTATRFIPHPHSTLPGARLYRSGDLARYVGNHDLYYLGRIDTQVKIRGFRIELGEIEHVLSQHPAVRAAAVLAHQHPSDGKRLIAYLVPRGRAPDTHALRSFLQLHIPSYMVPATFVMLASMPLNTNGKIDRHALARLAADEPQPTVDDRLREPILRLQASQAHYQALPKQLDPAAWLYVPEWQRVEEAPTAAELPPRGRWLVFADAHGIAEVLIQHLERQSQSVVRVSAGGRYERLGHDHYRIDPQRGDDYQRLFADLQTAPRRVVYLWGVVADQPAAALGDAGQPIQAASLFSLLALGQALAALPAGETIQFDVVANALYAVTGDEQLEPTQALLAGLPVVLPQEHPQLRCRLVDIDTTHTPPAALATAVLTACLGDPAETVVAYRHGQRWLRRFATLPAQPAATLPLLRQGGVYLITGGLGGIGLALAEYLVETVAARLVLVGRSPLPPRAEWEQWLRAHAPHDRTSRKIRGIQALEQRGAELLVLSADVAAENQLRGLQQQIAARFGNVHGIIHAAGVSSVGLIQASSPAEIGQLLAAKVQGTRTLSAVFGAPPLDFVVLCSSLASILGGFGMVGYCAANAFLDAFAHWYRRTTGTYAVSINWDTWQGIGMAADANLPPALQAIQHLSLEKGIHPSEGVAVFERVLASDAPQVIVSTLDWSARLAQPYVLPGIGSLDELTNLYRAFQHLHGPASERSYVAPRTAFEHKMAEIWQQVLEVDRVGLDNNFFDLGGHSLLATQVLVRLKAIFGMQIPMRCLFESPTVGQFCTSVGELLGGPAVIDEINRTLEQLEQLSEDSIAAMLSGSQGDSAYANHD